MMLGLGDVIAPGYLIAFAFYLDVRKGHKFHLYGFTAVVGEFFELDMPDIIISRIRSRDDQHIHFSKTYGDPSTSFDLSCPVHFDSLHPSLCV